MLVRNIFMLFFLFLFLFLIFIILFIKFKSKNKKKLLSISWLFINLKFYLFKVLKIFWCCSRNQKWSISSHIVFHLFVNTYLLLWFLKDTFSKHFLTCLFYAVNLTSTVLLFFIRVLKLFLFHEKWNFFDLFITVLNLFLHE